MGRRKLLLHFGLGERARITRKLGLGVLTAEQRKAFEDMKGRKIELPSRGGR